MERAAIRKTRSWNGSTATPGRRGSSMVHPKCTIWCWRAFSSKKAETSGPGAPAIGSDRLGAALRQNAHAAAVSTFHCVCDGAHEIASVLSTLGLLARGGTLYLLAPVI